MKLNIGTVLKQWRKQRRYSQLQLAMEIGISSKHISFLETGRSKPSRQMLLNIALFLNITKSEINRALIIAGFSPAFSQHSQSHQSLLPVFAAIKQMLENHLPYPALVLNHRWDLVDANQAAVDLMGFAGFADQSNFLQALIADNEATSKIINWQESMAQVLIRLRNEICLLGGDDFLQKCEIQLANKVKPESVVSVFESQSTVLTTQLKLNNQRLSFFSVIATLGAVQDVAIGEYKIELMFPVDDKTRNYFYSNKSHNACAIGP